MLYGKIVCQGKRSTFLKPKRWSNQFGNSPILKLNFRAEKQLIHHSNFLEVISGGELQAGTGINAAESANQFEHYKNNSACCN
ncbi:hypothetical protein QG516_00695 [Pedobacter gandavensis]|uniref:hypothetical protein n=1 Tax=Pedobacter TaxID=84567 RepID=UPI001C9976A6|nr:MULTISPECIES: hypothetical protein [Pedobacter]WGQ10172.1 hypothetical protein QG516_00695 [Pedobacter gandavensis]